MGPGSKPGTVVVKLATTNVKDGKEAVIRCVQEYKVCHRVLQGAAQRGAQFCFSFLRFSDPFFVQANEAFLP